MKTHFDPYFKELFEETKTLCGVIYPEFDPDGTGCWEDVTCKRCLKMKDRLQKEVDMIEKHIIDDMGSMVDFIEKQKEK